MNVWNVGLLLSQRPRAEDGWGRLREAFPPAGSVVKHVTLDWVGGGFPPNIGTVSVSSKAGDPWLVSGFLGSNTTWDRVQASAKLQFTSQRP